MTRVRRIGVREGYDLWSSAYDATDNPVVALDDRHAVPELAPRAGERILDAGCGTGRHLRRLVSAGSRAVGVDLSAGMLAVARRTAPAAHLVRGDIGRHLPVAGGAFDAALCALVGEHIDDLDALFAGLAGALRDGGRLVFTVYHPELAEDGKEANFTVDGVEYRLGAFRHTVAGYAAAMRAAGFEPPRITEIRGDEALVAAAPSAARYVGRRLLLVLAGRVAR